VLHTQAASSARHPAVLTFSTLVPVEQPSIAEENEPQRTQRKKPLKDFNKELCVQVRQISKFAWSHEAARRKNKPSFLFSALCAFSAFFAV
jgi:hypothetical protein